MAEPTSRSQTGALLDGFRLLARRPAWTLGLIVLGTLLSQLGPALEIAAKAGNNALMGMALAWAALLPMELYFIPRWLSRLDADLLGDPQNAPAEWPKRFDERWLRAFAASLLVQALGGVGLLFLIIPGVVLLTLLGFAPMRVLLRGSRIGDAMRWSARSMARHWPPVMSAALAILIFAFAGSLALALAQNAVFARFGDAGPDAWTRLKHPFMWISQAIGAAALLWVSAAFLSLYQRLEKLTTLNPDSPDPRLQ
ncbi:MAG: hypothetical protein JST05_05370 [Acidobacteria bacterium]|nr:hypothetical protein [Acidobacteriota bacterium]